MTKRYGVTTKNVYFIRPRGSEGPVKIGCSVLPEGRMASLMAWSPVPLEVAAFCLGDFSTERRLHSHFRENHSHGEWFYPSKRLSEFIAKVATGTALADLLDMSGRLPSPIVTHKRNYPPEHRKYLSYAARVRCAFKPLWTTGNDALFPPDNINGILNKWRGGTQPTDEQISAIESAIADPRSVAVLSPYKRPHIVKSEVAA